jgi:8-oxo-dGTP diphosphatase
MKTPNSQQNTVHVGIGVMILKDGKILLGKRKNSHGSGEYAFPGGHLEYMESFETCSTRETREECGVEIKSLQFLYLTNLTKYAPKHYVHIGMIAEWASGEPTNLEPEMCESWGWYDLNELPEPLFETCRMSIAAYSNKKTYFTSAG